MSFLNYWVFLRLFSMLSNWILIFSCVRLLYFGLLFSLIFFINLNFILFRLGSLSCPACWETNNFSCCDVLHCRHVREVLCDVQGKPPSCFDKFSTLLYLIRVLDTQICEMSLRIIYKLFWRYNWNIFALSHFLIDHSVEHNTFHLLYSYSEDCLLLPSRNQVVAVALAEILHLAPVEFDINFVYRGTTIY